MRSKIIITLLILTNILTIGSYHAGLWGRPENPRQLNDKTHDLYLKDIRNAAYSIANVDNQLAVPDISTARFTRLELYRATLVTSLCSKASWIDILPYDVDIFTQTYCFNYSISKSTRVS